MVRSPVWHSNFDAAPLPDKIWEVVRDCLLLVDMHIVEKLSEIVTRSSSSTQEKERVYASWEQTTGVLSATVSL